jgi:hypothetical protein
MDMSLITMANEAKKEANKQLRDARKGYVTEWVNAIVKEAKLEKAADKLLWKTAPWGQPLVDALLKDSLVINGMRFKHGEINVVKINTLVLAAPIA